MKANELMLNDYVLYKGEIARVLKLAAINNIDVSTGTGTNWRPHEGVNPNEVCPVPLTPEILEKNGWRQYSPYFSNDNADFELYPYRDGGFGIRVSADEYGSGTFACIKYVHQLQNALRLCGIEKEITI